MMLAVAERVQVSLAERLDAIDEAVKGQVLDGFSSSRLAIELGMWDKGEAVDGEFTALKSPAMDKTYRQLSRQTGRNHESLKKWRELYLAYPSREVYLPIAEERASLWAQRRLAALTPHVSHNTGESEWFTPPEYIEAARCVMGGIDVDPATTERANKAIGAEVYYTAETDGLRNPWPGRVWLNPPYAQPLVSQFCQSFADKYEAGEVKEGCVLINNVTETGFAQRLLGLCSGVCFPAGRVRFLDANGNPGAPLQGQMVLYFGDKPDEFTAKFAEFGVCLKRC